MSENKKTMYHIYGRTQYAQPLEFVQTASREELAVPEGKAWVEVIAFSETAVIHVIPRQKEKLAVSSERRTLRPQAVGENV